ncbi:MAG: hypothetical protein GX573_05000 [Chloroflexi bacterium]|nr:hypothetical protein [Chloroflexota bacterium]
MGAGDRAWVRVVGLRTEVEIDHIRWQVESVSRESAQHPWARHEALTVLSQRHRAADPPGKMTLEFTMPTGFHSAGLNVPLPQPALVWGNLLRQWNDLSRCRSRCGAGYRAGVCFWQGDRRAEPRSA